MNSQDQLSALSSVLDDNRYNGVSERTMDSQEQYEALLTRWGFDAHINPKPSVVMLTLSRGVNTLKKLTKAAFDSITTTAPAVKSQM